MQETAALLKELEPYWKSEFACRAAVCFDYRTLWALKIKPVNRDEFDYLAYCERFYHLLEELGIQADVISYEDDFERYEAVFLPAAFVMPESMREKCRDYVRKGGRLAATFLTGVKNRDNAGYTETLPAGLTDLFGAEVEELEPVIPDTHMQVRLKIREGGLCRDGIWSEWLKGPARPLAVYEEGYKKGRMVISENTFGEGKAFYIGTDLPDGEMKQLLLHICAGMERSPIHTEGVSGHFEVIHRKMDGEDIYFVFNFTSEDPRLSVSRPLRSLRTGKISRHLIQVKRCSFEIFIGVS